MSIKSSGTFCRKIKQNANSVSIFLNSMFLNIFDLDYFFASQYSNKTSVLGNIPWESILKRVFPNLSGNLGFS